MNRQGLKTQIKPLLGMGLGLLGLTGGVFLEVRPLPWAPDSYVELSDGSRPSVESPAGPERISPFSSLQRGPDPTARTEALSTYGKLSLSFEANRGQSEDPVRFLSRGSGYTLFLTPTEMVLVLMAPQEPGDTRTQGWKNKDGILAPSRRPRSVSRAVLRIKLVGADPASQGVGVEELSGKSNYFMGNDPARWYTHIPTYAKVKYQNIYPGVNLIYYGNQRQLEYDFVVAPGADPKGITLGFEGAENLEIDARGDLLLHLAGGYVRLHKPSVYQEIDGTRQFLPGRYVLLAPRVQDPGPHGPVLNAIEGADGGQRVGFQVAGYDPRKPLVIDPVLSYSTYFGGSGGDEGFFIAVDDSGYAYVTGLTGSADFPTENSPQAAHSGGAEDAFVIKLNPGGSELIYSTYLGGSGHEIGFSIAVDAEGRAYMTGQTTSTDFPTVRPFQPVNAGNSEAFVAKLNPEGSELEYSTYLGGSGPDFGRAIAVDALNYAYVTGYAGSIDFPTANPFQPTHGGGTSDIFVTKLNPEGSALVYSTYLGGRNTDYGRGIAVDASGHAYVTGRTSSVNFPTASPFQAAYGGGLQDAFVTKLNPEGSALVYSSYLGGRSVDYGFDLAVDASGHAYVTGHTSSPNFSLVNPFQASYGGGKFDSYVTVVSAEGAALAFSTYLGGRGQDEGLDIAVDPSGNAYVTGFTSSIDFPTVNPLQAAYGGGKFDVFVAKLAPASSSLVYSTYLGGSSNDEGSGIAVDPSGNAYVTGLTGSTDFPTVNPFQTTFGGGYADIFIAKISDTAPR